VPLPEYGYFSQADTKAPVYAPLAGRENGDPSKRGGRWTSDFIWNSNWAEQLDYQAKLAQGQQEEKKRESEKTSGGLSFSRVSELNSMDLDLSQKLKKPPPPPVVNIPIRKTKTKEVYAPPSQGEARRWARSARFSKKVVKVVTVSGMDANGICQSSADVISSN